MQAYEKTLIKKKLTNRNICKFSEQLNAHFKGLNL